MSQSARTLLRGYGAALLAATLALLLNFLWPRTHPSAFPLFFAAVVLATWYGGLGPGLLATILSTLAIHYFFIEPAYSFAFEAGVLLRLAVFVMVAVVISHLTASLGHAEEARRDTEGRYRLMVENVRDYAIIMLDPQGHVTSWNIGAERVLGYQKPEIIGRHFSVFFTPEDIQKGEPDSEMELAMPTGRAEDERWHVRKDGTRFWASGVLSSIRDEGGTHRGFVKVMRDLTERKQAEEKIVDLNTQLQQHNAELQTLLDVLPVGVAIAEDTTCQRMRLNQHFAKRWGLPANVNVSPVLPNSERPLHYKVYKEGVEVSLSEMPMFVAASQGIEVLDKEYQVVLDDRRAVAVWVSAAPLFDERGRLRGSVAAIQDVTERKRAEAERAELLAREQEARREAEAIRAEVEAAGQAKDRFLAMLSHELRTPLAPVLLTVSAMLDDPRTPDDLRPTLEMFRQNIGLEARLIDDLLDVMRTIRGKMSFHWDVADAHDLIRKALEICRSDIHAKQIRLAIDLAASDHHVRADAGRLQQVWWNLIKNAVKFTPEGGTITVRSHSEGGRLIVEVIDTGIGIEPGTLATIFNAFEQVENSITRRYGGLGLGLAISKAIVEAHGGTLAAASAGMGRGATFTLVLATVPAEEQAPPPIATGPTKHRILNILLVEDDAVMCRITAKLLRNAGYVVTTASSYDTALEIASSEFDLVVCDIGLPDRSGLDLMRELKGRYGLKGIALSGYGMESDIEQSRKAGFVAHLTKPVDFATLDRMIHEAVLGCRGDR